MEKSVYGKYFYGNEISEYGQEEGYVDYRTFAKAFNHVLCNRIIENTWDENWEIVNGEEVDEDGHYYEIFQYFIVDGWGAEIIQNWTDEILFYNEDLDMYVWGVTHFGTAWDYVLTDIACMKTIVKEH